MFWIGTTVVLMFALQAPFASAACNRALSANRLFLYGICAMLFFNALGLAIYTRELSSNTIVFYCACTIAFCIGSLFVVNQKNSSGVADKTNSQVEVLFVKICFILALVYIALTVPQITRVLNSSIQDLRKEHWNTAYDEKGALGIVYALARAGAGYFMINMPLFTRDKNRLSLALGLASAVFIFVETAAAGGRYVFIFFALATLINHYALKKPTAKVGLNIGYSLFIIAGAYFSLAVFPLLRNVYLASEPMPYFSYVDDVTPAPWILQLSSGTLRTVVPYKLQFYLENMRSQSGMMLGSYNIKYLSFLPQIFGIDARSFTEMREYISDLSSVAGYGGNPWSTGFRDLYLDFGKVGSVLASFCLGFYLTKWSAKLYTSESSIERTIGALASCSGLVFSFLSPFVVPPVLNLLLLLLVVSLASRLLKRQSQTIQEIMQVS
jgi:hypothetical protein